MANTTTASATRAGPRTRRRFHSTSTVSSMCRNRRWRRTPWRPKVRPRHPCPYTQGQTIAGERARELIIWEILVRRLSEAVSQVRDEQGYIVVRERVHRNTAESTNGRVKWWSTFQLAVVIGEGVFQVWWLKRFFEVRCASSA